MIGEGVGNRGRQLVGAAGGLAVQGNGGCGAGAKGAAER